MALNVNIVVEQLKLNDIVLEFLNEKDFLQDLKRSFTTNFIQQRNSFKPFFFNIKLRFGEIEKVDILNLITREPKRFTELTEEVIFCFLTSFLKETRSNTHIAREQIHCIFRFYDLPLIPTYKFSLKTVHINCALTTFRCVVVSKTLPEQYIRQSVWKCPKCFGLAPFILRNRESSKKTVSCEACLGSCFEILQNRDTSTFCSVQVLEERFKALSIASKIEIKLYDDLCQDLKLGFEYIVVGVFEPFQNHYVAWSIVSATTN